MRRMTVYLRLVLNMKLTLFIFLKCLQEDERFGVHNLFLAGRVCCNSFADVAHFVNFFEVSGFEPREQALYHLGHPSPFGVHLHEVAFVGSFLERSIQCTRTVRVPKVERLMKIWHF